MNLSRCCKITKVLNAVVAGQTTQSSSILDMSGFENVMFLAHLGDVDNTCVLALTAQQNIINSGTGMATVAGSAGGTAAASDYDNTILLLDLIKPREQFIRCQLARGTANAVIDGITAIQYNGRLNPTTHDATVKASAITLSPAEL